MPAYGMDVALKKKIASKRNAELDREVQEWIETVIEEKFPDVPYEEALKNGVILCKLINKLQPNAIPKYATSGGDFKFRENISFFQNAARTYGLSDAELFQTIDLFEKQNIPQVTQCLFSLSRRAQKKKFNGSIRDPKISETATIRERLNDGKHVLPLLNEDTNKVTNELDQNCNLIRHI